MNKNWAGLVKELLYGKPDDTTWSALADLFEEAGDAKTSKSLRETGVVSWTLPDYDELEEALWGGQGEPLGTENEVAEAHAKWFRTSFEKVIFEAGVNLGLFGYHAFESREAAVADMKRNAPDENGLFAAGSFYGE